MPKKPRSNVTVEIVQKPRTKRGAPKNAFQKGNQLGFKPGAGSPNPGGKPRHHEARISKYLLREFADRAPDNLCKQLQLPTRSSWGRCLARRLMFQALGGDVTAYRELLAWTEAKGRLNLFDDDFAPRDPNAPLPPPLFEVVFVESNGDGRPKEPPVIDAAASALPANSEPSA